MADLPNKIFSSTVVELNQRLIRREFSAAELVRAFAARMDSLGPGHQVLSLSLKKDALEKAWYVDKELKRGRTRGPLQGVPFAATELLSVVGRPTTWGSKLFGGQKFESNAAVLDKLAKSGALLTAKVNAVELGGAGRLSPAADAPFAAALTAGLAPYAVGLETFGSMLVTAAAHRLTILKPTYGMVSRFGAMPLAWTLDRIAVAGRSAEDCGHVLQAMAGGDDRDAGCTGQSFHFALEYQRPVSEMRIGFAPSSAVGLGPALDLLKRAGATLVEVGLPDFPYHSAARTILAAESSNTFGDLVATGSAAELRDREQEAGLRAGLEVRATEYLSAMRVRHLIHAAMGTLLAPLDLLVAAVQPPARTAGGASTSGRTRGLLDHLPATDLAGLPSLALPGPPQAGPFSSICLIAKTQGENALLQAGIYLQTHADWHRMVLPD